MTLKSRPSLALTIISICFLASNIQASNWSKINTIIKEKNILFKKTYDKFVLKNLRRSNEIFKTNLAFGIKYVSDALNEDYKRLIRNDNIKCHIKSDTNFILQYLEENNGHKKSEVVNDFFEKNDETILEMRYVTTLAAFIEYINDNSFSEETLERLHHKMIEENSITYKLTEKINNNVNGAFFIDLSSITRELEKTGYSAENLVTVYEKHINDVQEKIMMFIQIVKEK